MMKGMTMMKILFAVAVLFLLVPTGAYACTEQCLPGNGCDFAAGWTNMYCGFTAAGTCFDIPCGWTVIDEAAENASGEPLFTCGEKSSSFLGEAYAPDQCRVSQAATEPALGS